MSVLLFNDPGEPVYEIYDGTLGAGVFVRLDGHLLGVCADWVRARALVRSDISRRRRWSRDNPTLFLAA